MTGAISGAYNGISAIPTIIAKYLTDKESWTYKELIQLATECYELLANT